MTRPRALLTLSVVIGCVGQHDANPTPDSQPAAYDSWSLSDSAVWSTSEGGGGGQASFQFDRPGGAMILDDGRAVVGNRDHLVFLGKDGSAYAVTGRSGSGPMEFRRIHAVFPTARGLAAYDTQRRRLLLFGLAAQPQGEIRLPPTILVEPVGVESAGRIVVWVHGSAAQQQQGLVDSGGNLSEPYGSWTRARRMEVPIDVRGMTFIVRHQPGCTAVNLAVVIGQTVFVAEQGSGTIFSAVPGGEQRPIYRLPERTVDAEFVRKRQVPVGSPPGSQRVSDDILASFGKLGDPFPYAWDRMLADPSGLLWLRRVECSPPFDDRQWDIVDTTGALRAQLRTEQQLLAVNGRYVLALGGDSATVSLRLIEGR